VWPVAVNEAITRAREGDEQEFVGDKVADASSETSSEPS